MMQFCFSSENIGIIHIMVECLSINGVTDFFKNEKKLTLDEWGKEEMFSLH